MGEENRAHLKRVGVLAVVVAEDRLTAGIKRIDPDDPVPPTKEEIVEVLEEADLVVDDSVLGRVDEFMALADSGEANSDVFTIAKGRLAKDGRDEEFTWDPVFERNAQDWQGDAPVNYYTYHSIATVEEGGTVGTITQLVPAENGVDVHGNPIEPAEKPRTINLDASVQRTEDDPPRVIARIPGRVVFEARKVSIDKTLLIPGDLDFGVGNIDSCIDVTVAGTVRDRFELKSIKSITVGGAIEAATVHADGDVVVRGGILCRQIGKVSAGGDIIAKFCAESDLRAGGDIKVTTGIIQCRTHIEGELIAEHGALIGGHLYAKEGASIGTIGSEANVATRIAIASHPAAIRTAARIDESLKTMRQAIERLRQTIQVFMDEVTRLTPIQKEQVRELLVEAEEAVATVSEAEQRRDRILAEARAKNPPRVVAAKMIHPGVSISIGKRVTTFREELQGPVVIEKRKVDDVIEFVAVNGLTGSIQVLPSVRAAPDQLMEGFECEWDPEASDDGAPVDQFGNVANVSDVE